MNQTLTDQTLALAGMFQAAALVQGVAHRGRIENEPFEASLRSIVTTQVGSTEEAYGSVAALKEGLRALAANLGSDGSRRDVEQTRYVITLLHLERKLSKSRALLDTIVRGIENVRRQGDHFALTHDNVVASLADIYANTVSTLTPRIMVSGAQGHLNQPENANKVRALLLAGMRAAILWHWAGGSRLKLLLQRRRYLQEAERLLRTIEA